MFRKAFLYIAITCIWFVMFVTSVATVLTASPYPNLSNFANMCIILYWLGLAAVVSRERRYD